MRPGKLSWHEYLKEHWRRYLVLLGFALGAIAVGRFCKQYPSLKAVAYDVAAGIFSLFAFQIFTDYKNIEFISKILGEQLLSFQIGAQMHESHQDLINRGDAIKEYVRGRDTIKLLTLTADDYLFEDRNAYAPLIEKLNEGATVQILLFTPIYNLRSYLDSSAGAFGSGEVGVHHGQRHRHASDLIHDQLKSVIPQIESLAGSYKGRVEAQFFYVKHHVNMAIYGNKRIFAAPLLLGTSGRELPCLEIFPGLTRSQLFGKFSNEFDYLWDKKNLTFTLGEMKVIYEFISTNHPDYFGNGTINSEAAGRIEAFAEGIIKRRQASDGAMVASTVRLTVSSESSSPLVPAVQPVVPEDPL